MLRRYRRDHRALVGNRRKRRNLVKFIPEGDSDFAFTAGGFVGSIRKDAAVVGLSPENLAELEAAVSDFRNKLAITQRTQTRTKQAVLERRYARQRLEEVVRRYANIIRANPDVDEVKKKMLRLKPRPAKLKDRKCPQNAPQLRFLGNGDGVAYEAGIGNGSGVHVLEALAVEPSKLGRSLGATRRAKPDGAARLELFVDLVPQGQAVPRHAAELTGRPWYVGSFTTSRMEVSFPIPSEPMLVVYWGRWADAKGRVGRFSQTCVGRVEGWAQPGRAALPAATEAPRIETKILYVQVSRSEPAELGGLQHRRSRVAGACGSADRGGGSEAPGRGGMSVPRLCSGFDCATFTAWSVNCDYPGRDTFDGLTARVIATRPR